jgi:hypothetical protein
MEAAQEGKLMVGGLAARGGVARGERILAAQLAEWRGVASAAQVSARKFVP